MSTSPQTKAQLIASTLAGSWRREPSEANLTVRELEEIAPLLLRSGAGALGWWRVRHTPQLVSPVADELQNAYRLHALQVRLFSEKIKKAFSILRSNGIEPILIKGWANARLYPEPGLRPYGDIDLCVKPQQFSLADEILKDPAHTDLWVDLHSGLGRFDRKNWDEFYERTIPVRLDDMEVRVLGPEDHLRVNSIHFLDHGAWRPAWLCDIAALLEAATDSFDWNYCLGRDERRAMWIKCAVRLAHELLDARLERVPEEVRDARLPNWLLPSVLAQWERPTCKENAPQELFKDSMRHPSSVPRAILKRWPNPIEATIALHGAFNDFPRLPYQATRYLAITGLYITRLPDLLRARE